MKILLAILSIGIIIKCISYMIYMFKSKKYLAFYITVHFILSIIVLGLMYYI